MQMGRVEPSATIINYNHSLAHSKELGGHSTAHESSRSAPPHCILLCLPAFPTVKLQADHNNGAAEGLTRVCGPGSRCIPAATGPGAALRDPALALMHSTISRFQLFKKTQGGHSRTETCGVSWAATLRAHETPASFLSQLCTRGRSRARS